MASNFLDIQVIIEHVWTLNSKEILGVGHRARKGVVPLLSDWCIQTHLLPLVGVNSSSIHLPTFMQMQNTIGCVLVIVSSDYPS